MVIVVTLRLRGCKEENHPQDHGHEGSQAPAVPWFDSKSHEGHDMAVGQNLVPL